VYLPIRFPNEADVIEEEARAFRRLPADERWRTLFDLIASGMTLLANSPHRQAGQRLCENQEAEWQRIMKEFLARHGAGQQRPS
jgi:hypothetical protein